MLLLTLLLYLLLLFCANITGLLFIIPVQWYMFVVLFLFSAILIRISFSVIYSFQNEYIQIIKDICSKKGISKILTFQLIISILLLIDVIINKKANTFYAYLIPIGAVTLINLLGYDYLPAFLYDESEEVDVTIPELDLDDGGSLKPDNPGEEGETLIPEKEDTTPDEPEINFEKLFQWSYGQTNYKIKLPIRPAIYESYKNQKRVESRNWALEYASNGICGEIKLLSQKLLQAGKPVNSKGEVEFVLAFTQAIVKYVIDPTYNPNALYQGEYPKYPIETLVEEQGDCEDSSILGAAILKTMGYNSALIFLPGHCALGIAGTDGLAGSYIEYNNSKYYYCETTAEGWNIGQIPEGTDTSNVEVYPIPMPSTTV